MTVPGYQRMYPSAPPASDMRWAQPPRQNPNASRQSSVYAEPPPPYDPTPVPSSRPSATFGKDKDLGDNCSICLEPLHKSADADETGAREIAELKCQHIFHKFCIEGYKVSAGPSAQCPNCHACHVNLAELKITKLGPPEDKSKKSTTATPQPKPTVPPKGETAPGYSAGDVARGLGGFLWTAVRVSATAVSAGASVVASALRGPPKTVESVEEHSKAVFAKLRIAYKDLHKLLDNQKEQIEVVIATITSTAPNDPDTADKGLVAIEKALRAFEDSFGDKQKELLDALKKERLKLVTEETQSA